MNKIIFTILILLISSICYADNYRIAIISSYNPLHDCSSPQIKGFIDSIKVYYPDSIIRTYYLDSIKNQSKPVSFDIIIGDINKRILSFDPDYIVTFDDTAFQVIGIDRWLDKKPIFFSGVNKYPMSFDGIFKENLVGDIISDHQLYGIFEITDWLSFVNIIVDKSSHKINKLYILVDNTNVSKLLKTQLFNEFNVYKRQLPIEEVYISNVTELIKFITKNKNKHDIVYVMLRNVPYKTNVYNNGIDTERVLQLIDEYNRNLIITTINGFLTCKYGSYGTTIDFYSMGDTLASIMNDTINGVNTPSIIDRVDPINIFNERNSRLSNNVIEMKSIRSFIACQ